MVDGMRLSSGLSITRRGERHAHGWCPCHLMTSPVITPAKARIIGKTISAGLRIGTPSCASTPAIMGEAAMHTYKPKNCAFVMFISCQCK